ncbi:MAG: LptF/LptG family permease [Armatimonadota bacterium]
MRLLDRYIGKELVFPFLWGVGAFTVLLMGTQALYDLVKMAAQGVPLWVVARLFLLGLPGIIVLTFPMAMLLATLLSFSRLSSENEMAAFYASGISFFRILLPIVYMAVGVAALTLTFNEKVVPWTSSAAAALRSEAVGATRPRRAIIMPQYEAGELTRLVVAQRYNQRRRVMEQVLFLSFRGGRMVGYVEAREARYDRSGRWIFLDGVTVVPGSRGHLTASFDRQVFAIGRAPGQVAQLQAKPENLTFRQLQQLIAAQERLGVDTLELQVQLHDKLALPFACLVFALIGAPLGLQRQRGSSAIGLGLSILVIFGFYVVSHYMHILGANGSVSPAVAAWLPNILGMSAGVVLSIRAPK